MHHTGEIGNPSYLVCFQNAKFGSYTCPRKGYQVSSMKTGHRQHSGADVFIGLIMQGEEQRFTDDTFMKPLHKHPHVQLNMEPGVRC